MEIQPRGGDLRGLKALVAVLGVLVILGTALVIAVIIHRLYAKPALQSITAPLAQSITAPPAIPGTATALPAIANRLPAGEAIKSITAAGSDLAIWVTGPNGDRILLLNPATGTLTVAISATQ